MSATLDKPEGSDVTHCDEQLLACSSVERPLALVAASDVADDHSFISGKSAMPTLAALSVDDSRVANKCDALLPLKLLVPLSKSKELYVSPLLPQCIHAMVTLGTSMNQREAKINGMCSGLSYTTANSISISLFQWDPGEKTRAFRNLVVSRDITLAACVKELNGDSSGSFHHYEEPGYNRNHLDFPWLIQLSCSRKNAISKCFLKGTCVELLPYQFSCVHPFCQQAMEDHVAYAPAFPSNCVEQVTFEDFLLGSFYAAQSKFHLLYPEVLLSLSLAASSVPYHYAQVTAGMGFSYSYVSRPWEFAGHSLFDIWRAIQCTCKPWPSWEKSLLVLTVVRATIENGHSIVVPLKIMGEGTFMLQYLGNLCEKQYSRCEELQFGYATYYGSGTIQWEIAWTLRYESDFLVQNDRLQIYRLHNCILAFVEDLYELSLAVQFTVDTMEWLLAGILCFILPPAKPPDNYNRCTLSLREIHAITLACSSLFEILRILQSTHEVWSCILWSGTAVLLLVYGNSTLKRPMEKWDPGIARTFDSCTQYSHVSCHLISTAFTTELAHKKLLQDAFELGTMNYAFLHGHAHIHLRESSRRQTSSADSRARGSEVASNDTSLRKSASISSDTSDVASQCSRHSVSARRTSSWCFDEKVLIQSLYKVMTFVAESDPIILYIRDVDHFLHRSQRTYSMFQKMLGKLSGQVLILGSRLLHSDAEYNDVDDRVSGLFPYHVDIKPPEEEIHLNGWKTQMEEDAKKIQIQDNRNHIVEVLSANDLDCDDLSSLCQADTMILSNYIEEIIVSAVSYHLVHNKDPEYKNGKLLLSSKSLSHGLSIFQDGVGGKDTLKMEANGESKDGLKGAAGSKNAETDKSAVKDGDAPPPKPEIPDNEFEKRIRPEVIPASEIGVTFDDIGALDDIKESLQELVMLPLRRPDLFKGGGLLKPCRGILLFGPPGTGKTMLAKAIANDAGASFINVSMSTITSKWFGEDEKNVRALFSLAAKVAPTIIFIDEVDSMMGQRARCGEHEAMRKIKNEFMSHWDGILSKSGERILVLAATNRPFDLDEAIIRRFERRIMVGLPTQESRELILRTVLSKEKVDENIEYKELATMTEGYSGSDLKNLCMTAAYRPVRELLKKERLKEMERRKKEAEQKITVTEDSDKPESKKESSDKKEDSSEKANSDSKEESSESKADTSEAKAEGEKEPAIDLRPLTMEDLRQAKNQVAASFAAEGAVMNELKQWNDLYGEGGSRKKQQLTYFL